MGVEMVGSVLEKMSNAQSGGEATKMPVTENGHRTTTANFQGKKNLLYSIC